MEAFYSRVLQGGLSFSSQDTEDHLPRLLEILDVICGHDGEVYAHQFKKALSTFEGTGPLNKRIVLQDVVEEILVRVHSGLLGKQPFLRR